MACAITMKKSQNDFTEAAQARAFNSHIKYNNHRVFVSCGISPLWVSSSCSYQEIVTFIKARETKHCLWNKATAYELLAHFTTCDWDKGQKLKHGWINVNNINGSNLMQMSNQNMYSYTCVSAMLILFVSYCSSATDSWDMSSSKLLENSLGVRLRPSLRA